MKFSGSVSLRPVRIGFLVPHNELSVVSRVTNLSACLWGGRYNPLIPVLDSDVARWQLPFSIKSELEISRAFVDFFEPDVLVETKKGMAEVLGWQSQKHSWELPRVIELDQLLKIDQRGRAQFSVGLDILDVVHELYETEYKFERRHKTPFARVLPAENNAFFDLICGRYPDHEHAKYISQAYDDVFSPETVEPIAATASRYLEGSLPGPLWITGHGLTESLSRTSRDYTFYVFDPTDAGDAIDFWNFRLVDGNVVPINVHWLSDCISYVRSRIEEIHRPIPGNPFGTMFHSVLLFGSSISDESVRALRERFLSDLSEGSYYWGRDPLVWQNVLGSNRSRETKLLVKGGTERFDEEIGQETAIRIPAPSPTFLNKSKRHSRSSWANVISADSHHRGETAAVVYPTNRWSPIYPNLGHGDRLSIGREGWVLQLRYDVGYSLLHVQSGREAIIGWFKSHGIDALPSEEGQIAAQIIAAAGGLWPSAMFADIETLKLLDEMAGGRSELATNGKRFRSLAPDRSKHINTIEQHFSARERRASDYWSKLDYFLERSVFRAGLRIQCPVCGFQNWLDVNLASYKPTCTRCLNVFDFSQSPSDLRKVDWYYRVVGPFAVPDYARGGYAVALTLQTLTRSPDVELTWSTGLSLKQLNCEIDFVGWYRPQNSLNGERVEPTLIFGEAKSFGRNTIDEKSIETLRKVAERFPGSVMVISILREARNLSLAEIGRLRRLAIWGRQAGKSCGSGHPLVLLTSTEIFAKYNIAAAWAETDGKEVDYQFQLEDLHVLAEMTQLRYLGLKRHWDKDTTAYAPAPMLAILQQLTRFKQD